MPPKTIGPRKKGLSDYMNDIADIQMPGVGVHLGEVGNRATDLGKILLNEGSLLFPEASELFDEPLLQKAANVLSADRGANLFQRARLLGKIKDIPLNIAPSQPPATPDSDTPVYEPSPYMAGMIHSAIERPKMSPFMGRMLSTSLKTR